MAIDSGTPARTMFLTADRRKPAAYDSAVPALSLGVPRNHVEAYKWLTLALNEGEGWAFDDRTAVQKEMTPAQINEGQRLVTEFVSKPIYNPDFWER